MTKLGLFDLVIEVGMSRTIGMTHLVTTDVVSLTGVDHVVDWKILWPLLVSVCSRFLFWLSKLSGELRLV